MSAHCPQRAFHAISLIRRQQHRRIPASTRCVSLGIFRDKKVPQTQTQTQQGSERAAVPPIHHTSTVSPGLRLVAAVSARPKRDKRRLPIFPPGNDWGDIGGGTAGDDAWVVGKYYLGVADGVGAWNTKQNGQPALWSRLLMHYWALECEERIKLWKVQRETLAAGMIKLGLGEEKEVDAVELLQRAFVRTAVEMERTGGWVGSTTACVAILQQSALHIVNLGDSRAFIIRGENFLFTTSEQQHWYDCPYQVGTNSVDSPRQDATLHVVKLLPSDKIILATDGLGDNLWDQEILDETTAAVVHGNSGGGGRRNKDIQEIADSLVKRARAVGEDKWGESPFMEKAIMEGLPFQGGKLDDISVIVARAELDED